MIEKPTIQELNDAERFERIASVEHSRIKEFVIEQVMTDKKVVPVYMVYQTLLFLSGLFFFTRAIVLAVRGNSGYLLFSAASVVFSFSLLVVLHELLHGLALKITGAPKIAFGGNLRKFVFYAEADRFVLGRSAFFFVALTPLVVVQVAAIAGIIAFFSQPSVYFFLILMTMHSFFCSGDIALATVFDRYPGRKTFMYDMTGERKSYFFVEK